MAAHVRIQRKNHKVFFDSVNKADQQKRRSDDLQPNFDKLKQSITEEIKLENKEEDVIKQSTTDEIKLANKEEDAMLEDNLKVRVEELGARLMDFMNIFLQLQTVVKSSDDRLKTCIARNNEVVEMFNSDKVCLVEEWSDKLADIKEAMNAFDHRSVCFENEMEDIDDKLDGMRLASHPTNKKKKAG